MDAKSVVTSPSPQAPITHGKGPLVITGLAWSGRGAITRVDVTLDGGKSWREARLVPNADPLSLHRFYLDHEWDGSEMLIQSRCIDATGYVQPTKDALREIRGLRSVYHNNGHPDLARRRGWEGGKCRDFLRFFWAPRSPPG